MGDRATASGNIRLHRGSGRTTVSQAAAVLRLAGAADATARKVNSLIDKGPLPERLVHRERNRRLLEPRALYICMIEFEGAKDLFTRDRRRCAYEQFLAGGASSATIHFSPLFRLSLEPVHKAIGDAFDRYTALLRRIVRNPEIQGGAPVVKGTRIQASVLSALAGHEPREAILRAYPSIDAEDIEAARTFCQAFPARGRPRLPAGLTVSEPVATRALPA